MKKILLLFGVCFLVLFICIAQKPQLNFTFERIGTQEGLAHRVVNDIMQDHKGYIWIATQNGLQRYDGQRFMNWHKKFADAASSLPSDNVSRILEDHNHHIWVVCHNGIALLNSSNYLLKRVPVEIGRPLSDLSVYRFFEDSRHHIWLSTKEAGLLCYDSLQQKFVTDALLLPVHSGKFYNIIEEPATGNYWLSGDSGMAYADMKRGAILDYHHNPDNHPLLANEKFFGAPIVSMFIDSYLKFWITTFRTNGKGLNGGFEYDRYNLFLKKLETYQPLTTGGFGFQQDKAGNIWMTGDGVFQVWKPQTGAFYEVNKQNAFGMGFTADYAFTLCEDKEQNIWVASDNGVYVFNPASQHIKAKRFVDPITNKEKDEYFNHFTELPDGHIWAATWGSGIIEYDHALNQLKQHKLSANTGDLNYDMAWFFHYSKATGKVWIGYQLGRLAVYDIPTKTFSLVTDPAFDQRTIRSITEDRNGDIWFGTQHGLLVKRDHVSGRFTRYTDNQYPQRENLGNIVRLLFDNEWRLWAATQYSGLVEVNTATGEIKKAYRTDENNPNGISGNVTNDLLLYNDSLLLVATPMGINIFNKKTQQFKHITTEDGLLSNLVMAIQKDAHNNLWASTGDGFYKIAWPSRKIVRFGKKDGIMNDGFQVGGISRLNDGRMVSATSRDFEWFYPDSLTLKNTAPKVELTWVKVLNREVNIDSVLESAEVFELGYQENYVSIEFAALSFLNRGRLTYYCQLSGLETDWNKTNNYLVSTYANLKPGNYTYNVYAESSEGSRGPVTSFKIRIYPPWYNAWWFYCICGLLLLAILYALHRVRVNKILAMETVRNRIARDLHDDMGSTLSTINILSEMARRKVRTDTEKTVEYIDKIGDNSQRMMEAMDDIVWSINPKNDSMQRIVARMREYATNILEAKDIEFQFRAEERLNDIKIGLESRRDLFLIFKEAVNNLAKYSGCKHAHIAIKLHKKNRLVMLVEDDGAGFDVKAADDSGNGLINMKKRAGFLHGRLEFRSAPGKGTRVILDIPV